jgi:hypothetical protein
VRSSLSNGGRPWKNDGQRVASLIAAASVERALGVDEDEVEGAGTAREGGGKWKERRESEDGQVSAGVATIGQPPRMVVVTCFAALRGSSLVQLTTGGARVRTRRRGDYVALVERAFARR